MDEAAYFDYVFQSAPAIAGGRSDIGSRAGTRCMAFQSAPAIAGGRSPKRWALRLWRRSFNPRPPLLAGDPSSRRLSTPALLGFNPRPPLLAGDPTPLMSHLGRTLSFNPRPPLLAGDPGLIGGSRFHAYVSIRARHCWRAIPGALTVPGVLVLFQSAPAIAGGRSNRTAAGTLDDVGFNPRPPLLAGDPSPARQTCAPWGVSIRARHCWRAIRPHL